MFDSLGHWYVTNKGSAIARSLYLRHYSAEKRPAHADPRQFVGPGSSLVLLTHNNDALFVWRKFIDDCIDERTGQKQQGVNCAVFRNESDILSSDLIREADDYADDRWTDERHYTYVKPSKIRSTNPGCCFIKAGWQRCGKTKSGLIVLERRRIVFHSASGGAR